MLKRHVAGQGIVASANLGTIFQREIFFPVDPATLDWLESDEVTNRTPSSLYVSLEVEPLFELLPPLEAEIFWMLYVKRKHQKDVAKLFGISQPTVSYRYRRTLTKIRYLMLLSSLPVMRAIQEIDFLSDVEKEILHDFWFYLNQEMVGTKHDVKQSTVKWIFTKTIRRLRKLEPQDPERWCIPLSIMLLAENNFKIRVQN